MAHFTTSSGVRLNYRLTGKGTPPIVLIHGWSSNLRHWDAQARHFQRSHRVLRMDRPGFGGSGGSDRSYTWHEQADMIAELMRSQRIRNAVVVGHAGGTNTTLELATRHPERVRAIVIVEGAPSRGMTAADARETPLYRRLAGDDYLEALETAYRSYFSDLTPRATVDQAVKDAQRTPQHVALRELEQILRRNTVPVAKRVRQPALWVVTEDSPQTAEWVRRRIRDVRFGRTIGSGHFVPIDVPDQLNAMIERFI